MSERSRWQDVLNAHLHDQQPLTAGEVDSIIRNDVASVADFEERLPDRWWHDSFDPFPEGWTDEDDIGVDACSGVSVVNARDIPPVMRIGRQGEEEHKIILVLETRRNSQFQDGGHFNPLMAAEGGPPDRPVVSREYPEGVSPSLGTLP